MSEPEAPGKKPGLPALLVMVVVAAVVVVAGEVAASRMLVEPPAPPMKPRAANVVMVAKDPRMLPAPKLARPSVMVLGNSHTYALPGLHKGEPLRPDNGATLIDDLAPAVTAGHPERAHASFYLLSYPNFLPFEMLTRMSQLAVLGHRPSVVVLGLTWRNIARDSALRPEVHDSFHDTAVGKAMLALLESPAVAADVTVRDAVRTELRQADFDAEKQRMRAHADYVDERLTAFVGEHLTLVGKSADLRARLYRSFFSWAQTSMTPTKGQKFTYTVLDSDLAFNVHCLEALLRLCHSLDIRVLIYLAPERADSTPLVDPARRAEVMGGLAAYAKSLGMATIDAQAVVPGDMWGWEMDEPDRSHFTEPGHELLARFIAAGGEAAGTWQVLAP